MNFGNSARDKLAQMEQNEGPKMKQGTGTDLPPQREKYETIPSDGEEDRQISSQVGVLSQQGISKLYTPFKEDKSYLKDQTVGAHENQVNIELQPRVFLEETKDNTAFPSPLTSMNGALNQKVLKTKELYIPQGDFIDEQNGEEQEIMYGKTNSSQKNQEDTARVVNGVVVKESKNKSSSAMIKKPNEKYGYVTDKLTLIGCILMIVMNVITLCLFGALLVFEFRSASNLNTNGYSDGQFVFRSLITARFQDCFLYYRVIADFFLIIIMLLMIFCRHYPLFDYARNIIFYAGFACAALTFTRLEYLLYLDSYTELKANLLKYKDYVYLNEADFKTSFDNYYIFLKAYSYAIVLSSLVHLASIACANSSQEDEIKPKQKGRGSAYLEQPPLILLDDIEGKRVE